MADSSKYPGAQDIEDQNTASTSGTRAGPKQAKTSPKMAHQSKPHHSQQGHHRPYRLLTWKRKCRYGMDPKRNLFPKTKKYRYYPVTCEYCGKRMQPTKLKKHQRKYHFHELVPEEQPSSSRRSAGRDQAPKSPKKPKSAGGFPSHLKVCYICGQMFGSRSIDIHEPKCLEKWRLQNERLPARLRAPEPVKPEPIAEGAGADADVKGSKDGEYSIPARDPNAEAAYRSHLKTLIPCTYCCRTFSPDRIERHESCCIERPGGQKRATSDDEIDYLKG